MQVAFVGLGRMGGNMARRLIDRGQHEVFGFARDPATIEEAGRHGVTTADSLEGLVASFSAAPRVVWSMVPAGRIRRRPRPVAGRGGRPGGRVRRRAPSP